MCAGQERARHRLTATWRHPDLCSWCRTKPTQDCSVVRLPSFCPRPTYGGRSYRSVPVRRDIRWLGNHYNNLRTLGPRFIAHGSVNMLRKGGNLVKCCPQQHDPPDSRGQGVKQQPRRIAGAVPNLSNRVTAMRLGSGPYRCRQSPAPGNNRQPRRSTGAWEHLSRSRRCCCTQLVCRSL